MSTASVTAPAAKHADSIATAFYNVWSMCNTAKNAAKPRAELASAYGALHRMSTVMLLNKDPVPSELYDAITLLEKALGADELWLVRDYAHAVCDKLKPAVVEYERACGRIRTLQPVPA